ncbi:MAG: ActS/PrrB/RegB family redox-sensitive histidine kinase [Hyphomicrobiaceae bacterium]|nr:ActS/PrrB/RegB family redox-sensitive histidine kinase [Hyphomicrobiaceae bacterium]
MPPVAPRAADENTSRLRLRTIVRLRWIAVAGQAVTVALVYFGLGFDLPIGLCALVITLSVWLNIYLRMRFSGRLWLKSEHATAMLAYDILQLAALLYLTGGLQNPFAFLIVAPVTVSASKQPLQHTLWLGLLVIVCTTLLAFFHWPLPWYSGQSLELPLTYVGGVWAALVCGVIFFALYAQRIAKEARQMSDALAATEAVLLREQSMSALDGLAAAAAHELGTPLSTIAVVAKELQRELPEDNPHREDLALLKAQTDRCRDILAKLSAGSEEPDAVLSRMPISHVLEEAAEPHRVFDIEIDIESGPSSGTELDEADRAEPVGARNPGILYGLGNLIENAVDFAEARVDIRAEWDHDTVSIAITDDGPGFPGAIRDRLGEPYVTTRGSNGSATDNSNGAGDGMGLGFFIAKTLLERSGARLDFSNRRAPEHGARILIVWPRDAIEIKDEDEPGMAGEVHIG